MVLDDEAFRHGTRCSMERFVKKYFHKCFLIACQFCQARKYLLQTKYGTFFRIILSYMKQEAINRGKKKQKTKNQYVQQRSSLSLTVIGDIT